MSEAWRPGASQAALTQRAELYREIREFFHSRAVLEVETPSVSHCSVSDPHIASIAVAGDRWLQTSPEFAMKRLLAAGSGSIYQICKAFREGETGKYHNPEFTLLEWYRTGFDEHRLMDEVEELLQLFLPVGEVFRYTYADVFQQHLGINPHTARFPELLEVAGQHIEIASPCVDKDQCLELLFSHLVQPEFSALTFVCNYPASQAALARVTTDSDGYPVARRFECFYQGTELANGYHELTDADEYLRRCEDDNARRISCGLPAMQIDSHFVEAMQHGLPECAGVALGLDRLLMLILRSTSIADVLSFAGDQA